MHDGSLGTLTEGALADMLLVDGDPLAAPSVLTQEPRWRAARAPRRRLTFRRPKP